MQNSKSSSEGVHTGEQGLGQPQPSGMGLHLGHSEMSSHVPDLSYFPFSNGYICMMSQDYAAHIRITGGAARQGAPPKPGVPRYPSPKPTPVLSSIAKLQQRLSNRAQGSKGWKETKKEAEHKDEKALAAAVTYFATGELYLGYVTLHDLCFEGPGCLISPGGTFVVGEFFKGRCQGISLIRYANGDTTIAEFQLGIKDGECLSHNQESGRKVRATFSKGTVVQVSGLSAPVSSIAPRQNLSCKDIEEVFPEIEFSLEALIESCPLFLLYQDQEAFFVGTADKQLGLRIREGLGFDIGFFRTIGLSHSIQPHGHCRRIELSGNFVDGIFKDGDLDGPAVCYLKTSGMWTHGIYDQFKALETLMVSPNHEVPPLVALQAIKFPPGSPKFQKASDIHVRVQPFSLKELEFDYVKNAMEGTLNIDIKQEGPEMLIGKSEPEKQLMEVIQEEDEAESTRAGDSVWAKSAQCKVSPH